MQNDNVKLSTADLIAAELVKLKGLKQQYSEALDSDLSQTKIDFILNEIAECKAELLRLRTLKACEEKDERDKGKHLYSEDTKRFSSTCSIIVALISLYGIYLKLDTK